MSLWKERFHLVSGAIIEAFNGHFRENKYRHDDGWIKAQGDDENSFVLINLANIECIEFEKVEE